jgi:hypothetical protein
MKELREISDQFYYNLEFANQGEGILLLILFYTQALG